MTLGKSGVIYTEHRDESFLDEVTDTTLPGKAPKLQLRKTVPETDTGRQGENPKALERTRVKELGKIVP